MFSKRQIKFLKLLYRKEMERPILLKKTWHAKSRIL